MKTKLIVVDVSKHELALAPILLGAAKANNAPARWRTGAVFIELSPGLAAHRVMEEAIRSALPVHVR